MSAANWRQAMNSGSGRAAMLAKPGAVPLTPPDASGFDFSGIWKPIGLRHVAVLLFVLAFPAFATPFFTYQIGAQSLALGLIAMSLTFLGGYGGMVSLAQMTVAGVAGYLVAILGAAASADATISLGWPWWLAVPVAIAIATLCATFIGWLSVRT